MKVIQVTASKSYQVLIGSGILSTLGQETRKVTKAQTAAIISDTSVWPLYGEVTETSLRSAGFRVVHYVFPAGEASKNGETYLSILDFLARNHITRTDCIVALGGGVVGDISGFAAATFKKLPWLSALWRWERKQTVG